MHQNTFVKLSALGLGLVLSSFMIRGFSQFAVSQRTANWLSAPTMLLGAGLIVVLTVQSVLVVSGLRPLEE
jgi:TM2 domain-containing membrane protein YozV